MKLVERTGWITRTGAEAPAVIDENAGVIHGVKILGLTSRNGRRYQRSALNQAVALYEKMGVNLDHSEDGRRSVVDGFGRLCSVTVLEDGLYGDLEYLKSHEFAPQFVEAAKRMPEQLGLSQTAEGRVSHDAKEDVVEEITKVHSVDVVRYPATTQGLFEMDMSQHPRGDGYPDGDMIRMHFRAAMMAVLEDSTLSQEEVIKKITAIMKAETKVAGAQEGATPAVTPETIAEDKKADKPVESIVDQALKDGLEAVKVELAEVKHSLALSECIQSFSIDTAQLTDEQMKQLREAKTRAEMDRLAESLPRFVREGRPIIPATKRDSTYEQLRKELVEQLSFK